MRFLHFWLIEIKMMAISRHLAFYFSKKSTLRKILPKFEISQNCFLSLIDSF